MFLFVSDVARDSSMVRSQQWSWEELVVAPKRKLNGDVLNRTHPPIITIGQVGLIPTRTAGSLLPIGVLPASQYNPSSAWTYENLMILNLITLASPPPMSEPQIESHHLAPDFAYFFPSLQDRRPIWCTQAKLQGIPGLSVWEYGHPPPLQT